MQFPLKFQHNSFKKYENNLQIYMETQKTQDSQNNPEQ